MFFLFATNLPTTGASVGAEFDPMPIPAPPSLNKRSMFH